MSYLSIQNLSASYGNIQALRDVSLEIEKGEIVSIVGANGAGKTTLLTCISGLMPHKGTIIFDGEEIANKKVTSDMIVQRGIVQVPEGRQIFPELSVMENLRMGAYCRPRKEKFTSELEDIFKLFPRLGERKNQKGASLSGGEQQMLALGRAMMARPKLLLLDEPSMGLAPIVVSDIFKTIHRLNESGVTIVLIEQNAKLALKTSKHAYVLQNGRIMLSGNAKDLAQNPQVKALYLGG